MKFTTTTTILVELPADGASNIPVTRPVQPGKWNLLSTSIALSTTHKFIVVWSWVADEDRDLRPIDEMPLPPPRGLRFICPECRASDWRLGENDRRHCSNGRCGLSWTPESDWKYFFEARPFADRKEFEMHQKYSRGMEPS